MTANTVQLAAVAVVLSAFFVTRASASEPAEVALEMEIVAASIRDKGHVCERVVTMQRVDRFDDDIRAGWVVQCTEGRFRVVYIGNRGFEVTPLAP